MAYDDYEKPSYEYEAKPQQPKPRKKKVVEPPIATRNCRVSDIELVKGEPVTGLSENTVKNLKTRGLVK